MSVTINDVARLAGVSKKTVSRVLNHEQGVRPETRDRVYAAMTQLGFRPNISAQRLARGRSWVVGLIFYRASWYYIDLIIQGVLDTLNDAGYKLLIHSCDVADPGGQKKVLQLVEERQVDGLIFIPPTDNSADVLKQLDDWRTPFVRISPSDINSPWPFVAPDDFRGAFDMTSHLLELGHRRIGLIKGDPSHRASHRRLDGYVAALEEYDLPVDETLIKQGDFFFDSARLAALSLLTMADPPTAIFASNDDMAAGVLSAAHGLGIRVPEQLSVGGFDDVDLAHQVWPPLTTIHQPIYDTASEAARILLQFLSGETPPELQIILPTSLVARSSTDLAPQKQLIFS
jgi:LacI family transcriptional regulator